MLIANPIYVSVFKYLMEDNKVAKLIVGAIIGEKIVSLDFRPQEYIADVDKTSKKKKKGIQDNSTSLTVYRLDFSAKIRRADGSHGLATIELQKAKYITDIMRFRGYLGNQYANKNNTYQERIAIKPRKETPHIKRFKYVIKAIPIINIYFLGDKLDNLAGYPVIKVERHYMDAHTGLPIESVKDPFIECLSHDSFIIQIPDLTEHRRSELEQLLSVFDQSTRTNDLHILNVKEEDIPTAYRPIIRRLQQAASEPEVRKTMIVEDEILDAFEEKEREIEEIQEMLDDSKKELEDSKKELEDNKKELEDSKKVIEDSKKVIEDKDKELEDSKKELENQKKIIEALTKQLGNKE